ncbi:MAG: hypothetical protein MZW92_59990 [Comamonadaceae bacterium]|nr:hypothetical protein [Comamonadaceae bacterium]
MPMDFLTPMPRPRSLRRACCCCRCWRCGGASARARRRAPRARRARHGGRLAAGVGARADDHRAPGATSCCARALPGFLVLAQVPLSRFLRVPTRHSLRRVAAARRLAQRRPAGVRRRLAGARRHRRPRRRRRPSAAASATSAWRACSRPPASGARLARGRAAHA